MLQVLWMALLSLGLLVSLVLKGRTFIGFVIGAFFDGLTGPGTLDRDTVVCFWMFLGLLACDGVMIWDLTAVT